MLRYKADRRTLGFVVTYFTLTALMWVTEPAWYLLVPLMLATCSFSWFLAVATHNTVHCPVFKNKRHNKVFQCVLTLCYGHPVSSYVPGHNLSHHKFTQTSRDVMRTYKARFRLNMLNGLLFFFMVGGSIMKNDMLFTKTMRKQRPKWFRQMLIEFAVLGAVTIALFVLDWRKALLFWMLPHLFAQWGIITINYLQHDGCDADSEWNHSRNFVGRFFGWWTFENGFHTIHHIRPGLHWSLCREAHAREVAPHIHPNLDEPSMAKYIWRTFIWKGGKREMYDGRPYELPEAWDDENWIPTPQNLPADLSLGAETRA